MSKKHKKKSNKIEFKSRRDLILQSFPEPVLNLWFGDDEKQRNDFATFLMMQDEIHYNDDISSLIDGKNVYEQKIDKLKSKPHKNCIDLMLDMDEVIDLTKKNRKNKKYSKMIKEKDLGLATYLDGSRYSKKYLNKNKYRKELKKIAKSEKNELKEMRKLGYIKSTNVDDELKRLKKASDAMSNALSDAYVQKHFLE